MTKLIEQVPPPVVTAILFVLGLCIGSFLNVCVYRLPQEGASIVKPRSYCPACKKQIRWHDNVPLLSFVALGGKCRDCKAAISIRYPVVELLTAGLFVALYRHFGATPWYPISVYFACSLLVVTLTDLDSQIIPDEVTVVGMLAGLLASFFFPALQGETWGKAAIGNSVLGLLVGGGLLFMVGLVGDFVFKRESMGGGDVKLLAMLGTFVGPAGVLLVFFFAPVLALPVGLTLKLTRRAEVIPFGPYLALSGLAVFFWGPKLLSLWMRV